MWAREEHYADIVDDCTRRTASGPDSSPLKVSMRTTTTVILLQLSSVCICQRRTVILDTEKSIEETAKSLLSLRPSHEDSFTSDSRSLMCTRPRLIKGFDENSSSSINMFTKPVTLEVFVFHYENRLKTVQQIDFTECIMIAKNERYHSIPSVYCLLNCIEFKSGTRSNSRVPFEFG